MAPTRDKELFAGCKIAICGTFGDNYPKEKIKRFIRNHGGIFVPDPKAERISHLICSIKAYKARTYDVRNALETQDEKYPVRIVKLDWLIDCIGTKKRRPTAKYDPAKEVEERRLTKLQRKLRRKELIGQNMASFQRLVQEARIEYNIEGYHLYSDPTGFGYDIVLTRNNVLTNSSERAIIRMFESHQPPYEYAAFCTYVSPVGKDAREVLAPKGSEFTVAFEAVKEKFMELTHHLWSNRGNATHAILDDGTKDHSAFVYHQPEMGPLGMDVPVGRAQTTTLDQGTEGDDEVKFFDPRSEQYDYNHQDGPELYFSAHEEAQDNMNLDTPTPALGDNMDFGTSTSSFTAASFQPANTAAKVQRQPVISPYPAHAVNAFREFADQYHPASFSSAVRSIEAQDLALNGLDASRNGFAVARPGLVDWDWGGSRYGPEMN